jgi:hypothetical protein
MKALKDRSFVGKVAGFVSALNVIPFVDPQIRVIVFAAASLPKDAANGIGDLLDDGQPNQSLRADLPIQTNSPRTERSIRGLSFGENIKSAS